MLKEMLGAFLLIFMAEMGDKSQFLAMLFASRYKMKEVLMGVFLGILLNHGFALIIGVTLGNIISIECLSLAASIAFLYFAFTSLQQEQDEKQEEVRVYSCPILVVMAAFFIGELGDKTQLTTITLGMEAKYPLALLAGTVSAMVLVSSLGILIGGKLKKMISPFMLRLISACLFFVFGMLKLIPLLWVKVNKGTLLIIGSLLITLFLWEIGQVRRKEKTTSLKPQQEM